MSEYATIKEMRKAGVPEDVINHIPADAKITWISWEDPRHPREDRCSPIKELFYCVHRGEVHSRDGEEITWKETDSGDIGSWPCGCHPLVPVLWFSSRDIFDCGGG